MILVGPSGCGKSTALNMIAGLEDITSGELRIGGEVVNQKAPRDRDIAMVFQSYALYPHMTVRDNIAFALKLAKRPKEEIDAKVNEAADILDLGNHLDRKPANLSGGQRQRVAMGRAIVRNPKAFLMDEPLSNLDAKLRVQMRAEVARIQHRLNTTTVYVTHDQTEAMTLGDRVAIMLHGELQQVASPMELYNHPQNLFVAGFIGSPGMNFLPATIEDGVAKLPMVDVKLPQDVAERVGRVDPGKKLIAGIRPEDFEDAAQVGRRDQGPRDDVQHDVRPRRGDGRGVLRPLRRQGRAARVLAGRRPPAGPGRRERDHRRGRQPSSSRGSTPRARSRPASRPRSGSTRRRCTSSTRTPASR